MDAYLITSVFYYIASDNHHFRPLGADPSYTPTKKFGRQWNNLCDVCLQGRGGKRIRSPQFLSIRNGPPDQVPIRWN